MDVIQNSHQFTDARVKRLNYCRLFLKAVTLSDISHTTGTRLDMCKLEGRPSLVSSETHGPTIYQETPSTAKWILWKRANRLWSDVDGSLHKPLGPWILHTLFVDLSRNILTGSTVFDSSRKNLRDPSIC
jgi:hypothetical protein